MKMPYPMSKDEAAKNLGAQVYDCALPQTWLDDVVTKLKTKSPTAQLERYRDNLYGHILGGVVWCYDICKIFGAPFCLTEDALRLVNCYQSLVGQPLIEQKAVYTL